MPPLICPEETATAGPLTLERLAEAVRQQQRLGLPVLVSGGLAGPRSGTYAGLMSAALEDEFRIPVRWREDRSSNTFENASFSAAMLRQAGVSAAIVVTHPWHMARTLWAFRAAGFPAIPAPTPDGRALGLSAEALLPQVPALLESYYALHELIGLAWYLFAYGDW